MKKPIVLVTGSDGLIGNAIKETSKHHENKYEFVFVNRKSADLTKEEDVRKIYDLFKPNYVIHAAAKVGGIQANLSTPGKFFYENILMNSFMIHYGYLNKVEKFFAFSSVCVFPDKIGVLSEDVMLQGEPFSSNYYYGWAKRMIDLNISCYKIQYGIKNYCSLIPGNIFGPHDNYSLQNGHVLASLIHRLYLAKKHNTEFIVWANEIKDICDKMVEEYMPIKNAFVELCELPNVYLDVNDFCRAYSSICWNKDIPAINKLAKDLELNLPIMFNIEQSNNRHPKTPFHGTRENY